MAKVKQQLMHEQEQMEAVEQRCGDTLHLSVLCNLHGAAYSMQACCQAYLGFLLHPEMLMVLLCAWLKACIGLQHEECSDYTHCSCCIGPQLAHQYKRVLYAPSSDRNWFSCASNCYSGRSSVRTRSSARPCRLSAQRRRRSRRRQTSLTSPACGNRGKSR